MSNATRDRVFISYSRNDKAWLDRLQVYLKPLERDHKLIVWDDTRIRPGTKWREEIGAALAQAKVAVMLVSPHFLASDFISKHEVPALVAAAENDGLTILWVALSACMYKLSPVSNYQSVNDPSQPLDSLDAAAQGKLLTQIAELIMEAAATPPSPAAQGALSEQAGTDDESRTADEGEQTAAKPDETGTHISGDVNRSILGGSFGDNNTFNFGDNSGNR